MKAFFIKTIVALCLLGSVPAIAMAAEPSQTIDPSNSLISSITKSGGVTAPMISENSGSTDTSGTVSTQGAQAFNGGLAKFYTYAIGSKLMDADWTLISDLGPITYVNMTTRFDDGYVKNQAYGCFGVTIYDTAQHKFSKAGYHTATLSGNGYQDLGLIYFSVPPMTDGATVY